MTHAKFIGGLVAAGLAVTLAATDATAGPCYNAGGSATMITTDLAKFMAEAALKNSIAGHGWKASGPIKMECKDDGLTTTCTARRLACK